MVMPDNICQVDDIHNSCYMLCSVTARLLFRILDNISWVDSALYVFQQQQSDK